MFRLKSWMVSSTSTVTLPENETLGFEDEFHFGMAFWQVLCTMPVKCNK